MHFAELHQIEHALAMLNWDEAVMMPPGGGAERGEALAALAGISHRALTADEVGELLNAADASSDPFCRWQRANLRAMRRLHTRAVAVPEDIVRASQVAAARCQQIWRRLERAGRG
jgi:carboxypeptidase Taq